MAGHGDSKAVFAALAANLGIAATKIFAWLLTGATSMLAEAIHSVADSGNQGLLLLGGKRSRRAATPEHPFGFGRERFLYAFLVSIVLFSVGGLFALYEAYHKFQEVRAGHPDELLESSWWWVPVVVLVAALCMEAMSIRTAIAESNKDRGDRSWWAYIRDAKAPELPVVLLEDAAALLGLAFALFGVSMTLVTGNGYFDVVGAAAIGLLLIVVAVVLGAESTSLLIGESATAASQEAIRSALECTDGVTSVIHLRTLHISPESVLVAAKIGVRRGSSAQDVASTIDRAEANVRSEEPMAETIYLEPDIHRADRRV